MINQQLIKEFRLKVNSNSFFALHNYRNKDGRNHWNLICSCMDWIDVAIDYITNRDIDKDKINVKCLQAYTYISAIDIVWQSIQQLHRVIIDRKSIPFVGDKTIFLDNRICKDDNEYFKHIRAVFGAHPVNLDRGGKWFASWPTDHVYHEYDFAVILYSANIEDKNIVFGYRFKELEQFLDSRYGYLNFLINDLENQFQNYIKSKSGQKIEHSDNIIEQLKILKRESKERLNNDYYSYLIDDLLILYQVKTTLDINRAAIEGYLIMCQKLVAEIYTNLQNMEFSELENGNLIDLIDLNHSKKIHYHLSKIYECLRGFRRDFLYNYYLDIISEFLKDFVTITNDMHYDEVFLLIKVGLFNYWNSKVNEEDQF